MTDAHEREAESDRVTRHLRDEIVDGVRPPGSRLVEREIATDLGVSRIPVRDALRQLAAEGLVTPRPRSWAVVREFTAADVADLHEVRTALEQLAFRLAVERRTRDGLARLRETVDRELRAAEAGDAIAARRAAADFHEVVTGLAANDLLDEVQRSLRSRMRWLLSQHDDLIGIAREHEALHDAIADRDAERIDRLVEAHLGTGYNRPWNA
jgi:DNA-binding GntR family transcriptional regulator